MATIKPWTETDFTHDPVLLQYLPAERLQLVSQAEGDNFWRALTHTALQEGCIERVFIYYEDLMVEVVARWTRLENQDSSDARHDVNVLQCLAKIFPFTRYFKATIKRFLSSDCFSDSKLQELKDHDLRLMLLAIFRLLSTDPEGLSDTIKPTFLSRFFNHESLVIRYLAIQCMCIVMRFADALEEKLVFAYVGEGQILGQWEDKQVDYRLLKLLEETRWADLKRIVNAARVRRAAIDRSMISRFDQKDVSSSTVRVGGVLVPGERGPEKIATLFVNTPTATLNLGKIGQSLLQSKPTLIIGPGGSGKTTMIHESARLLNQQSSMITLHLNEQTDAKSLLGLYTSSASGDVFEWQPGILTKAVQQGRWVLIEDIDRAPSEVLGVLRPIIENGELVLPSRKERVRPKEGFKIFATIKTSSTGTRSSSTRHAWLANERLWSVIEFDTYSKDEIEELLRYRYPHIAPLLGDILSAHDLVCELYSNSLSFRAVQGRLPSLRDLLKWCRRSGQRVASCKLDLKAEGMPLQMKLDIFRDAVDCYAALHSDNTVYREICECLAQALHVSPAQTEHTMFSGDLSVIENETQIKLGRSVLPRIESRRYIATKRSSFAMTNQAKRIIDSVAASASHAEPVLLVGETGVGKTTQVQYLANLVNQKLTVVNLSQQSEAADLLGGLKPITTRSLVIPLVDQFTTLFDDTFSSKRNEKFQIAISKAIAKENWPRLVLLWQEAVQMADNSLRKPFEAVEGDDDGQSAKRRKLASKYGPLRDRWTEFSSNLNHIRAQVERGDKNHSFAFVEGRLLQAVRAGEWLLLDEINLAAADTLDHIVGLLGNGDDEKPTLLLAEAGTIEQITAHPNFRIFAAMNPATDTGKKDLAPGIRSRFTELYVRSGDDDLNDLTKIIETYLGPALSSDKRAGLDLAKAYLQLKRLNEEHKLTDGAGDIPHFSIRSLVRCLLYIIQHNTSHGLRRSMYEGFAMSFFTVLSIDSENLALPILSNHLLANVKNPKSFLAQQPKMPFDGSNYVAFRHHLVLRGSDSPDSQPHYIRTPSVERNLLNLARAASMRRFPILLQGPTSAGKTSMVEYLAKLSGNRFVRINNHEHTDLQEYLGNYGTGNDGKLEFREGVLVEALRKGHWIVLDELNLAPSDVLEALNRLLDDNRELLIPESQEIVRPHPRFMLFATQNPAGIYGGRKRLSRAFRNRFLELHFDDIPEDELEVILRERAQIAPSFCTEIVQVYKKLSLQRQSTRLFESRNSFATLRDLFRWAARSVDDRQQLARHGFMLLAERVRDAAERKLVKKVIEETMKVKLDEAELYGAAAIPEQLRSDSTTITWTSAMRRLFVLVSEALKNNEPVLLVGETGCGKTQICQTIAQGLEKPLSIYNAHSNTETGDLIGSQRPIRQRSELATAVLDSFSQLYTSSNRAQTMQNGDIDELIDSFHNMDTSEFEPTAIERTRQSIAAYQSLFTWSDGSLVRSMKSGEHFLLDEISLADDSVLERLNSVLEPSRTILLAEKGSTDNLVIAHADFQFLATMNPGGDYGKRELSAALRNRLTEIWVPPLSQDDDILPILRSKLGTNLDRFASGMLSFATWFKDSMQNSAASTISLRALLSWAEFMRHTTGLDAETAFVHGAFLVYIDSLGANPAGLTNAVGLGIQASRKACLDTLQSLTTLDSLAVYNEIPLMQLTTDVVKIGQFSLQRSITEFEASDLVFDAPTTLRNTMRIVRALQLNRPILLEGSPGVGKTAIVTALAATVGKSLTRINLSDQTDLMDLFGADVPSENEKLGRFSWRDGPLLQAMQTGGWVLLDEMNLASQSVLEGLNSCLDHRHEVYIAELDKSFICHPEFTLFAAQNPHHQGGGRKGLPASFVNRFTVVYADSFERYDLMLICERTRPEVPKEQLSMIIDTVANGHDLATKSTTLGSGGPWELNLRDVNRWLDLTQEYKSLPVGHHFETIIAQRFRSHSAMALLDDLRKEHLGSYQGPSLYHNLSNRVYQLGTSLLERNEDVQLACSQRSLPSALFPYVKSMITAINHRWPIVLAGPSGCGKTFLIRSIAALSGAKIVEFSMNADVDTMDLIGGFEQYDLRRDVLSVQSDVCQLLMQLIRDQFLQQESQNLRDYLLAAYEHCTSIDGDIRALSEALNQLAQHSQVFGGLRETIKEIIIKSKTSRFVWNDGILIDALQKGSWLVLDNANLCNPSVLDRLNSLLEPNGVLVMSEQPSSSKNERVITPHPNFRIFLVMDPKYGELSRAMRNRSLELFIASNLDAGANIATPTYSTSSAIYRLREMITLLNIEQSSQVDSDWIQPSAGALSEADNILLYGQAHNFIPEDDTVSASEFEKNAELCTLISPVWQTMWPAFVSKIGRMAVSPRGLNCIQVGDQPRDYIQNDALIKLLEFKTYHPRIEISVRQYLLELRRAHLQQRMNLAIEGEIDSSNGISILQRSIMNTGRHKVQQQVNAVPDAIGFLNIIINEAAKVESLLTTQAAVTNLREVVALAEDLFNFFQQSHPNHNALHAYMEVISVFICTLPSYEGKLKQALFNALSRLGDQCVLKSGRSLQRMWSVWRPTTPSTHDQLQAMIAIEDLLAKFDHLTKRLYGREAELAGIRSKICSAYKHITNDIRAIDTVSVFSQAVNAISQQSSFDMPPDGHFVSMFEWLQRRFAIQGKTISELDFQRLFLFTSSLPVVLDLDSPSIPNVLRRLAYIDSGDAPSAKFSTTKLLVDLRTVTSEPLRSLENARAELKELARAVSSYTAVVLADDMQPILQCTHQLLLGIISCHHDLLTARAHACLSANGDIDFVQLAALGKSATDATQVSQVGDFKDVYALHLLPIITAFSQGLVRSQKVTGVCLISVCVAALKLLVPDKAFDPAAYPTLLNERHLNRTRELQAQIAAYKNFQKRYTGEETSTLISILEEDICNLGEAPPAPRIIRPAKSELSAVQQEFNTVLNNVLDISLLAPILSCITNPGQSGENVAEACKALSMRIVRIVERMNRLNRAYDDFVKPVVWLLGSLSYGVTILSDRLGGGQEGAHTMLLHSVPLLGSTPQSVLSQLPKTIASTKRADISWLERTAFLHEVDRSSTTITDDFLCLTDKFYIEWKTRLTRDQAEAEAGSKYYAYRGGDDEEEAVDERELASLFPTFDGDASTDTVDEKSKYDARGTSSSLASIHMRLYDDSEATANLQQYIRRSLTTCSTSTSLGVDMALDKTLPGLMLQMQNSIAEIENSQPGNGLNLYTDSDLMESRKLVGLVRRIQTRFREITERWPEHAIPLEVLGYSEELLSFKINEPIAKLLTKTEKLFAIVSQWQSVASREWSVSNLTEELTSLIIHWRRLELSSWSRLLDLETKKVVEDANAWYFIAYEAVLYNSILVVDQAGDIGSYCLELANTLEDFFKVTTLGQYNTRLKLLQTFSKTLDTLSLQDNRLSPIVHCIESVLYHYGRYRDHTQQILFNGRAQLEKNITEQIKLASWKDTNIQSLKDSAKRSHYKLFKIVKKYRALISQPMTSFRAEDVDLVKPLTTVAIIQVTEVDKEVVDMSSRDCTQHLTDWSSRPERLTNPLGAAASMRKFYSTQIAGFNTSAELADIREEIASNASELRKQTPSTLTEDNKDLARHLKERKKRLLAQTIKDVIQMGVRRNLATTELSKQSSTSRILASSPDIAFKVEDKNGYAVNAVFHEILDLMPAARKAAIDHSDELTDGETKRAMGLLEGLLSIQIAQRHDLSVATIDLEDFSTALKFLKGLQNVDYRSVTHVSDDVKAQREWVDKSLVWLPLILETSCQILEFQSVHGNMAVTELIDLLQDEKLQLTKIGHRLQALSKLPSGLFSASHREIIGEAVDSFERLRTSLGEWQEKQPNVAYLLQQLVPWTEPFSLGSRHTNGMAQEDVSTIDSALRTVVDSVFVAMQSLASVHIIEPQSSDDQGWLAKSNRAAGESFKSLHLHNFTRQIVEVSNCLQLLPENQLSLGISLVNMAMPVLDQYSLIATHVIQTQLQVHHETTRLGVFLTKSFTSLANEGFCSPREPSGGQDEKSGKLESGTGLGEGEGAEDISKDVDDDEDLSELAQAQAEKQDGDKEMDKEENAVDMGVDDLEGDMGSEDEKGSDEDNNDQSGSEDENDMDEEAASVDDLDPSAVDEKLWDDMKTETEKEEKEMKGDKQKGQKTDEQTAKEDGAKEDGDSDMEGMEEGEEEESEDNDEGQGRPEAENVDPHLQEEETLELPEEMQLTGEEEAKEGEVSDDGMDELSDMDKMDQPVPEEVDDLGDKDVEEQQNGDAEDDEDAGDQNDEDAEGKAQDDEVMEDQDPDEEPANEDSVDAREDEMQYDIDDNEGGDTGMANKHDQTTNEAETENEQGLDKEEVVNEQQTQPGKTSDKQETGDAARGTMEQGAGKEDQQHQKQDDALKHLANILEQYHQRRDILTASEERKQGELDQDAEMADADFEHLGEDEENSDAQALGAASADQVQKLDESKAIEHKDTDADADEDLPMPEDQKMQDSEAETLAQRFSRLQNQPRETKEGETGGIVPDTKPDRQKPVAETIDDLDEEEFEVDRAAAVQLQQQLANTAPTSQSDAAALWSHCSNQTHMLSILLTEQLRLILAPTTATKLRGDFRTGKRLNIKRIIPYIASGYKRDKIWMRRSIPSKRNYQIMIAVDDSKSMSESGADLLAFETLAMLCKSLSMLEVGELCVVSFGDQEHITVAHPFNQPFTGVESGTEVFQNFSFQQRGTDVRRLLRQSISIFEEARLRSSNDDLWQLQLIVSDGHCSDHDSIRRLVRMAHEQKIMVVFVIVDAGQDSIVDLKEAVFERLDPTDERSELKVKTKRYLEGFPFGYYVVVREVGDLPGVLARVLRGWFEGVVNVG